MTTKLSLANLDAIKATAAIPAYDRVELEGRHRSFRRRQFPSRPSGDLSRRPVQHRARSRLGDHRRRRVLPSTRPMRAKLEEQDFLTTVVEQDNNQRAARVTGADDRLSRPGNAAAIVAKLADPAIRIVSLTITEGGYFIDPASGHVQSGASGHRCRRQRSRRSEDGVRPDHRRTESAARTGHRAVHGHVLRQHPGNGEVTPCGCFRPRAPFRSGACRVDRSQCRFPERHGRPHHAGDRDARGRHRG